MEILCKNCSAKLTIPEDKIPQGQRVVSVNCPRCHEKIFFDTTPEKDETASPPEESREDQAPALNSDYDDGEEDHFIDSLQDGEKLAIVMSDDEHETDLLKKSIEGLGYRFIRAETPRKAISMMRFNNFDLVVMSDTFNDIPFEKNPVLDFLNHLPMFVRRQTILVLFGERFKSNDRMMGFTISANIVVNSRNLDEITDILAPAISDQQMRYRVFFNTLEELDKV
jgi:predicted Zn finger-like uncharacterized protein